MSLFFRLGADGEIGLVERGGVDGPSSAVVAAEDALVGRGGSGGGAGSYL